MPSTADAGKRGYLRENFRFVRLKDSRAQQIGYHYHEFDKVILLLGGKVTYVVEGVTYFLQPWDLLLVPHDRIHRPIIDPSEPYERVVLWLGQDWLRQRSAEERAGCLPPGGGAPELPPSAHPAGGLACLPPTLPEPGERPPLRGLRPPADGGPSASSCC